MINQLALFLHESVSQCVTVAVFFPPMCTSQDVNDLSDSHDQKSRSDRTVSSHLFWHMTLMTEQHKLKEGEPRFVSKDGDR